MHLTIEDSIVVEHLSLAIGTMSKFQVLSLVEPTFQFGPHLHVLQFVAKLEAHVQFPHRIFGTGRWGMRQRFGGFEYKRELHCARTVSLAVDPLDDIIEDPSPFWKHL